MVLYAVVSYQYTILQYSSGDHSVPPRRPGLHGHRQLNTDVSTTSTNTDTDTDTNDSDTNTDTDTDTDNDTNTILLYALLYAMIYYDIP